MQWCIVELRSMKEQNAGNKSDEVSDSQKQDNRGKYKLEMQSITAVHIIHIIIKYIC